MFMHRTVLVVLLVTTLCTCQEITTPVTETFPATSALLIDSDTVYCVCYQTPATVRAYYLGGPQQGCYGCHVYADTSSGTVRADADIVVTAYSILSPEVGDAAECVGVLGVPYTLPEPYTITRPATIPSYMTDFQTYVSIQIFQSLGAMGCAAREQNLITRPTPLPATANSTTSLLPAPSASLPALANSTTSPTPHSSNATNLIVTPPLDKPTKIGIGIGVFLAGILLISLVAVIGRKRGFRLAAITAEKQRSTQDKQEGKSANRGDGQPYLQHKPELEAEEQQRHELEAWQKIYELDGETEVKEFPGGIYEHRLAVMRTRQELRGGEHGQELDS